MRTIYQFQCSTDKTLIAFTNKEEGENLPTNDACNGKCERYQVWILEETTKPVPQYWEEMLIQLENNGYHVMRI